GPAEMHQLGAVATNHLPLQADYPMERYFAAGRESFVLNNFLIQSENRGSNDSGQHPFQQPSHQQMHFAAIAAARAAAAAAAAATAGSFAFGQGVEEVDKLPSM